MGGGTSSLTRCLCLTRLAPTGARTLAEEAVLTSQLPVTAPSASLVALHTSPTGRPRSRPCFTSGSEEARRGEPACLQTRRGALEPGPAAGPEEPGARLGRVPHRPAALARGWSAPFADQYQPIDFHSDRMKGSANDSKKPSRPRPDAINPARLRWPRHGPYDDRMALF